MLDISYELAVLLSKSCLLMWLLRPRLLPHLQQGAAPETDGGMLEIDGCLLEIDGCTPESLATCPESMACSGVRSHHTRSSMALPILPRRQSSPSRLGLCISWYLGELWSHNNPAPRTPFSFWLILLPQLHEGQGGLRASFCDEPCLEQVERYGRCRRGFS